MAKEVIAIKIVVALHFCVIAGNLLAIGFIVVNEKWWIALPLITFLLNLVTNVWNCPLTMLENSLRIKAGLPTIRSFIKHYILK